MPLEVFPNPPAQTPGEVYRNIAADNGRSPTTIITDIDSQEHLLEHILFGINDGIYGDGADGYPVFDGTTTVLGLAPSSSIYTLTRDLQCAGITVNTGVTIQTAGFVIRCNGTTTLKGTALITNAGNAGANNGTAGAAIGNNAVGGATAGGAGGVNNGTNAAAGPSNSIGANGGAGGNSNNGAASTGGSGNTVTAATAAHGSVHTTNVGSIGAQLGGGAITLLQGGAGGGGGAGDGTNTGGGGGGGGGIVVLCTKTLIGGGAVSANGGAGGAGASAGNTGGGGGGGGGGVYLISRSVLPRQIGNNATAVLIPGITTTVTATGGVGGANHGANGLVGVAGNNGTVILLSS